MIREIVKDELFLTMRSAALQEKDEALFRDLKDTLLAHKEHCVGMAANMIGIRKQVIVFFAEGAIMLMVNPQIVRTGKKSYIAEEGCLSLKGVRSVKRYEQITVSYLDEQMKKRMRTYRGFCAQIIQHEIDHCNGILI